MATSRLLRSSSTKTASVSISKPSAKAAKATKSTEYSISATSTGKRKLALVPDSTPSPKKVQLQTPKVQETKTKTKKGGRHEFERPAEPHMTNAPLVTPRGSRLVAFRGDKLDISPSKPDLPRPTTTTSHILDQACAHLIKNDHTGKLKPLIEKHHCEVFCPEGLAEECEPFKALCSGIISQQVSGAAASSIQRKFIGLFCEAPPERVMADGLRFPEPAQVAPCTVPFLRTSGLSERKAEYIKGLAEKFAVGELSGAMLLKATDEEMLEKLIAVRGLGKWSVEMFATFGLKRMDILSTGDLGIQRGMAAWLGKDVAKLKAKGGGKWKYLSEQEMIAHSEKFAPYRFVAEATKSHRSSC